jgi:prepilin-type N-terminal cleavage/methylation domain-containing protein
MIINTLKNKKSLPRSELRSAIGGFTLPEILVSVFILSLVVLAATTFERDVFSVNYALQGSLNAQLDARHVVKVMVTELRKAEPSASGAYPIASASSTSVTFYSDINADGVREKVRYFISGGDLKKGVVTPSGTPPAYTGTEKVSTIISGFVSSSTLPLFQYYPSTYTGTTSPLSSPIDIPSVRLVKIAVIIDQDPNKSPVPLVVTSQVSLRNLKDNL